MDEVFCRHPRIDRERLRRLEARSDARGLLRLAGHGAALAASGWLLARSLGGWGVVPAAVLHGALLIFLFAPLHECIHRTAFRRRWLNDAVGWLAGAVIVLPPTYFRCFHFAHHRHTQDPANDPELARPKPATLSAWLLHVSGLPTWRFLFGALVRHALGRTPEPFIPARTAPVVVREARLLLAAYAAVAAIAVAAGTAAPLIYWIGPALVGQPLLRLFLLAEHTGCATGADMLANTRTTLTHPLVRFFTWNMPFHAEHHAYPSVPFHALPALHRDLRPTLRVLAAGYVAASRDILRALRADGADAAPRGGQAA